MSLTQRIKQGYLRLPGIEKLVLFGSASLMLSPLMPWYDSMRGYTVETILGVEGPMFLMGIFVGGFGLASFLRVFLPMSGLRAPLSRFSPSRLSGICGLQSLLILALSNSVFFHPDFALSSTHKATRMGMFAAFLGVFLMLTAAYFGRRVKASESFGTEPISEKPVQFYSAPLDNPEPMVGIRRSGLDAQESFEQMSARDRYKAMSQGARQNLWQRKPAETPYGATPNSSSGFTQSRTVSSIFGPANSSSRTDSTKNIGAEREITDNMRIRTDL